MPPAERRNADRQTDPADPRLAPPPAPPAAVTPPRWPPGTPTPCTTAPGDRPPASHSETPPAPHTHPPRPPHPDTPVPAAAPADRNRPSPQWRPRREPPRLRRGHKRPPDRKPRQLRRMTHKHSPWSCHNAQHLTSATPSKTNTPRTGHAQSTDHRQKSAAHLCGNSPAEDTCAANSMVGSHVPWAD